MNELFQADTLAALDGGSDLDVTRVAPGLSHTGAAELGVGAPEQRAMLAKVTARLFGDDAEQPTRIGRFELVRRLGAGGMGVVYLARDPELDRAVAIKHLHPRFVRGDALALAEQRMRREARAMARLAHPHVVHIHEVGTHDGQLFLAMEYVDGLTLSDWLRGERRGWRELLRVFCEAGEGLDAAHEAGLVHRDFKPENVLVSRAGAAKVTDFGLASMLSASASTSCARPIPALEDSTTAPMTRTGALMGTPLYMSPEQFAGEPADARSDQFSFCVALYEALVGARPFTGSTFGELAASVSRGALGPRPRVAAPSRVLVAVERGLRVAPEERWPSMGALLEALRHDPTPRRRRRLALAGLAVGLASAAGGYAWSETTRARALQACETAGAAIEDVWGGATRARALTEVRASGISFAESSATHTADALDAFTSAWRQVRTDTCVAARVERRWSPELSASADACLEERREQLESFVETLEETVSADELEQRRAAVRARPSRRSSCRARRPAGTRCGCARARSRPRTRRRAPRCRTSAASWRARAPARRWGDRRRCGRAWTRRSSARTRSAGRRCRRARATRAARCTTTRGATRRRRRTASARSSSPGRPARTSSPRSPPRRLRRSPACSWAAPRTASGGAAPRG
ncbi:MAG: serine/threonine protein kinase [Myxococcales bacterium]|nr:serine/threonine protein kinase [Myxococcales bacterium]